MKKEEQKILRLAKVNNQNIVVVENGVDKFVPIKPICDALGIATNKQIEKIKEHPILSSTATLRVSVGADGKDREMFVLPYEYIFGWLFTIDSRNVKPEAAETVLKYQIQCYHILYDHFIMKAKFEQWKLEEIIKINDLRSVARFEFKECKNKLSQLNGQERDVISTPFEQWSFDQRQYTIPFPENKKVELNQEEA